MQRSRILFLAGMPRSGTTFFQYRLCKLGCVCLGEVSQTVNAIRNNVEDKGLLSPNSRWNKSSLKQVSLDGFWKSIEKKIREANSKITAIELVYQAAFETYPNCIIVDSSKHIGHLKSVLQTKYNNDVMVLHIIRDYRSWIPSFIANAKKYNLKKPTLNRLRWLYVNLKINRCLKKGKISSICINYDQSILLSEHDTILVSMLNKYQFKRYEQVFHEMFGSFKNMEDIKEGQITYQNKWILTYFPSIFDPLLHLAMNFFNKVNGNAKKLDH